MPEASAQQPFVCIHGHFYQPPRENPWLESVEVQDSAQPYHDWNERVTGEAYAPNAAARLLDAEGRIIALYNNYTSISFNFGPTLLSWMERARPELYAQVLLADQESRTRFGRGNAIAQVYGHCIMPLASRRDQRTQVRWGIADFVHRFGRLPDGMWLPETAVDRSSLSVLAENGIRFTILAPSQARRVRNGDGPWQDVHQGRIDTTRPYRCTLGRDLDITLFFYDAELAHAVAFDGLLTDGREFARRLVAPVIGRQDAALSHLATDGETYGHHHRFGEMALAAALRTLESEGQVRLTNYASFLDQVAVRDEAEVWDNSSWSCAHGIERWRANCGCHAGHQGWTQSWRGPLREAMEWLKVHLDDLFERQGDPLLRDPWAARDAYAIVLLHRDAPQRDAFLERQARKHLSAPERVRAWKLLEMQRFGLLMFTSCGWFFDEPSGLETVQVMTYAARAMQLAADLGTQLETEFLRRLQPVHSNLPHFVDGRHIYRDLVRPLVTDHGRVLAHYAMSTLLEPPSEASSRVHAFAVTDLDRASERAGAASVAIGNVRLFATATEESDTYVYAALHLGGHDMHCAIAPTRTTADYERIRSTLLHTFASEPLSELVRRIDRTLDGSFYSLRDVFVDQQRRIIGLVTAQVTTRCTADYERIVSDNRRLLDFLTQAHAPLPEALRVAATYVIEQRVTQAVERFLSGTGSWDDILGAWADARRWDMRPPMAAVQRDLEDALVEAVMGLGSDAAAAAARAHRLLDLSDVLELELDTWAAQNPFYVFAITHGSDEWPAATFTDLRRLAERLSFCLPRWEDRASRAA